MTLALKGVLQQTMACGQRGCRLAFSILIVIDLLAGHPLSSQAQVTQPKPLRIVMDDNYPPYVMRTVTGQIEGILIDEWHLWEKKTGIPVEITATDWERAQQSMQAGKADVIDTMFRTPARESFYDFGRAYEDLPVGIFHHISTSGIHNPASLSGFQIGVKAQDACIEDLARAGITTVRTYPSYESVIKAALAGKVRIFCMDEPPANYLLQRLGADENFRLAFTLSTGQFHRAVHKGDTAILTQVERGFAAIGGGEYKKIRQKWLGEPIPYTVSRALRYVFFVALFLVFLLAIFILLLQRMVRTRTAQLTATQAHLQATLDALPDILFEFDAQGRYLDYHAPRNHLLAVPPEKFLGKPVADVLPQGVAQLVLDAIQEAGANGFSSVKEYALNLPRGETWFALSMAQKTIARKAPHYIALARDITAQKISEQKRLRMTQLYAALSQCNQAIVRCQSEEELFPVICRDAIKYGGFKMAWIGRVDKQQERIIPVASAGDGREYLDDIEISTRADDPRGQGPSGKAFRENAPYWCHDFQTDPLTAPWHERGRRFGWRNSASLPLICNGEVMGTFTLYGGAGHALDDAAQELLQEMVMDISFALQRFADEKARLEAAALIEQLANYDPLTKLPNRLLLRDRVQQAIAAADRSDAPLAILFLDLDHFKNINDSLGHTIGDDLLRGVSERLLAEIREQDTVARWGGDEFIFLLSDCTTEGATRVAEKLLTAFSTPFQTQHHELNTTPSIGIAMYPTDGMDFDSLAKAADTAMYRAKQEGRNTFRFFTSAMQTRSQRFLLLENALRTALKKEEFFLHFQPQFNLDDGRLIGAEALVRWHHPTLGLISPGEFITIAELSGQILQLGAWVMQEAIRQAKAWQDQGLPTISMAVNLSAVQFRQKNLAEQVRDLLSEVGLEARYLELELTESLAMEDPLAAIKAIDALHATGVTISIDDFGTGYSSLSYLKRFRISKLKIDQSFVRDIASDPNDKAIVDAIITMAHSLGFTTIAEGVETTEQLAFLHRHGCHEVQGYYFSQPLSAEEFERFFHAHLATGQPSCLVPEAPHSPD